MTTVAQLINYLQTLPPETDVQVLKEYSSAWSVSTFWVDLCVEGYSDNCELLGDVLYIGEQ